MLGAVEYFDTGNMHVANYVSVKRITSSESVFTSDLCLVRLWLVQIR